MIFSGVPRPESAPALLRLHPVGLSQPISIFSLVGLPLLYASSFYLPPVTSLGAYFLPSSDVVRLVVLPTILALIVGSGLIWTLSAVTRRWVSPTIATIGSVFALSLLILIGLKGVFYAAGYDWRKLVAGGDEVAKLRLLKYSVFFAVFIFLSSIHRVLPKVSRLLASLGFAFGVFATVQLLMIWRANVPSAGLFSIGPAGHDQVVISGLSQRRVIWIIFDETDFGRTFGNEHDARVAMPNFDALAQISVFAKNARSPASGTLYSIPALLTGTPMSGRGIRIDGKGILFEDLADGQSLRFGESSSIFGTLEASGRSVSLLGFYHPYCRLFRLQRCDSFAVSEITGLDAALLANLPDAVSPEIKNANIWESITERSLRLLPEYLDRDDALTFIHLNFPHPPADYADRVLELAPSSNPLTEYAHNLALADQVLGQIVERVRGKAARRETLLIVSTDHWLRNMWYQPYEREASKPVPFMVWKVGENQGLTLPRELSTVHTAAMVLDYLDGKITTQVDIQRWWLNLPVYPSFIAPAS